MILRAGNPLHVDAGLAGGIVDRERVGHAFGDHLHGGSAIRETLAFAEPLADGAIAERVQKLFDLRPYGIETKFGLRNPIYSETAAYGHMGRTPEVVEKQFKRPTDKGIEVKTMKVELFTWEKLDSVDSIKKAFGL